MLLLKNINKSQPNDTKEGFQHTFTSLRSRVGGRGVWEKQRLLLFNRDILAPKKNRVTVVARYQHQPHGQYTTLHFFYFNGKDERE